MAKVIAFFVEGTPQPGGSKKALPTKSGRTVIVDDAKYGKEWRGDVKRAARDHYTGEPLDCALDVRFVFFKLRPKGHFGTGKNASRLKASAPKYPTNKPDALKLARSTEDALTGILWRDDCSTVDLSIRKRYGLRPGAQIYVAVKGGGD